MRLPLLATIVCLTVFIVTSTAVADPIEEHLGDAQSLYYAGHWEEAHEAYEKAYTDAEAGSEIKAAAALQWGSLLWEQGEYDGAERLVNEALDLARELGLDEATGELLATLGHIEASKGELASADNTLDICIELTTDLGDDSHRALCRINRRMVRTLRGKSPGSEDEFRADIATLANAESALSTGTSLAKTAELYRDNQDFERAEELLDQAHQIYADIGSVPALTRNRLRQAQLMHRQGKFDEAQAHTEGLLEQFEKMRNRPMIVHTLALHAEDELRQENLVNAVVFYRRSLEIAEEIQNPQLTGRVHLALCEIGFAESPSHCREAADVFGDREMAFLEIRAHAALGRSYQSRNQFEEARTTYRDTIEKLEAAVETDDGPHALSHTLLFANLCQVEMRLRATGTLTTCREALDGLDDFDEEQRQEYAELRAATVHAAGRSAADEGRAETAAEYLDEAARLFTELDDPAHLLLAADTLLRLGDLQNRMDSQRERAPETFRHGLAITAELDHDEERVVTTDISLKTQLAQRLLADDEFDDAVDLLEELTTAAESQSDDATTAWAYSGLARAYLKLDRSDDAVDALRTGLPIARRAGDENLVSTIENNLERLTDD